MLKRARRVEQIALSRRLRLWGRRLLLISSLAMMTVLCAAWGWLGYTAHGQARKEQLVVSWYDWTAHLGLSLEHVYLEGHDFVSKDVILSRLDIDIGGPILALSLGDIKADLEAIDWVDRAVVERHLPHTLHLHIFEKQPVAVWQTKGTLFLIDAQGEVIGETGRDRFLDLILLVGQEANLLVGEVVELLASEPALMAKVGTVVHVGKRRWNMVLRNGVEIKLPEQGAIDAWHYVAKRDAELQVLSGDVSVIDLRVMDRVFITPKQG
jgi:cell division protein FtsQ